MIIMKMKKLEPGWSARQIELPDKKCLDQEGDHELHDHSDSSSGESVGRTTTPAALHQSGLCGRVDRQKPLWVTACLSFAKQHVKDSDNMRINIHWPDETKL